MKKPIHIAMFLQSLRTGGAERTFVNLANAFADAGHKVDLIILNKNTKDDFLLNEKVNKKSLGASRTLFSIFFLKKYIHNNKPDILLATQDHVNIIAAFTKSLFCFKTIFILRETTMPSIHYKRGSFIFRIVFLLMKIFYRRAHFVIANSTGVANDLIKEKIVPRNKIKIIHNPVVLNASEAAKSGMAAVKLFPKKSKTFISAGRFIASKNFSLLIDAFSLVRKKMDAQLIILGDGIERKKMLQQIKGLNLENDVIMPGYVNDPAKWMQQSDVFVLSSNYEGFPNVMVEALAAGCNIISTDCPSGPREILKNEMYGRLVPVNNTELLAMAMEEVIMNLVPKEKSYKRAADFAHDKIGKEYLNLFEQCISEKQ